MLVSALDSHSHCVCFSEVFNAAKPMFWARRLNNDSRLLNAYRDAYPQRFLDRLIFGRHEEGIEAVGFKAFPEHIKDPRFAEVLRSVIANPQVRLIHLKRRNKLAQYLSLVRAHRTGVWSSNDGKPDDQSAIRLNPAGCEAAFERMEAAERFIEGLIGGREALVTHYENITRDPRAEFERVQAYIGLSVQPIQPMLRKQRLTTLSEAISNFKELQAEFAGTAWAGFFDPSVDPG